MRPSITRSLAALGLVALSAAAGLRRARGPRAVLVDLRGHGASTQHRLRAACAPG